MRTFPTPGVGAAKASWAMVCRCTSSSSFFSSSSCYYLKVCLLVSVLCFLALLVACLRINSSSSCSFCLLVVFMLLCLLNKRLPSPRAWSFVIVFFHQWSRRRRQPKTNTVMIRRYTMHSLRTNDGSTAATPSQWTAGWPWPTGLAVSDGGVNVQRWKWQTWCYLIRPYNVDKWSLWA